jgi:SHAQKYF class myb-like DNA-binding protein
MEKESKKLKVTAGRWTRAEHDKFMDALEKYGRDWVKVQKKVKTRTLLQIRSHAQKVFLNMT